MRLKIRCDVFPYLADQVVEVTQDEGERLIGAAAAIQLPDTPDTPDTPAAPSASPAPVVRSPEPPATS